MIALERGEFSIRGIPQVCCDAPRKEATASAFPQGTEQRGSLDPSCNPGLMLPEKSSKSTGSPANMRQRGGIPLVLSGGKNDICMALGEIQDG